jgi:predicted DNA-binding transcriptional regulator AlpA
MIDEDKIVELLKRLYALVGNLQATKAHRKALTRAEMLERIGLSNKTYKGLEAAGDGIPKTQLSPGRVCWLIDDIDQWLSKRRV